MYTFHSDDGLTLETSEFRISLWRPIYIINSVDKTKSSCNTFHRRNITVSVETYPFKQICIIFFYQGGSSCTCPL